MQYIDPQKTRSFWTIEGGEYINTSVCINESTIILYDDYEEDEFTGKLYYHIDFLEEDITWKFPTIEEREEEVDRIKKLIKSWQPKEEYE